MRTCVTIAAFVSVVSLAGQATPVLDLGLGKLLAAPLAIFVQHPGTQVATVSFGDYESPSADGSSNGSSSSSHGSTSLHGSSSSQGSSSSSHGSSSSSHGSSSSSHGSSSSSQGPSSSAAPSSSSSGGGGGNNNPETSPPPVQVGGIPDGQGNNFNTVAGAVRFPWNYGNSDNVVPITPSSLNGGWAMSPNQKCVANSWCPYACAPGYYSAQWDPNALLYNGQGSMNGGLYADANGRLSKPFADRPFCAPGMFNARMVNTLGRSVSACQTVYPGNEAMIIPSVAGAGGSVALNIVPNTYWLGTSSQFYVNLAGSTADQCVWGDSDKPVGNWGPYIFGGGQGKDGNTYISGGVD
ncbi:hypothetical protein H4R26_003434 [Coemansia thaxteri]|uniref:Uncharacterized protein n=1 Tax=Coemansia thaxteri TaxID=2663907 RepID=A0A9W8EHM5_9FUNG|nr:hypothetical protein H4R26_003434 [Coemansia thaxteri]